MSTQPIDSDTEETSGEHSSTGSAFAELLATSSFEELVENAGKAKLSTKTGLLQGGTYDVAALQGNPSENRNDFFFGVTWWMGETMRFRE